MSLVPGVEASATSATTACSNVHKRVNAFINLLNKGDLAKINKCFSKNHFIKLGLAMWNESTFQNAADGFLQYDWVHTSNNSNFKLICEGVYTVSRRD